MVRHPLSGAVEFTSTDAALAAASAEELDRRDPVTAGYIFMLLHTVPPVQRQGMTWVMPSGVWLDVLRWLTPTWPFQAGADELVLVGKPVELDEAAEGITVRLAGSADG